MFATAKTPKPSLTVKVTHPPESLLCEKYPLNTFDDVADKFRQLLERWNHRLTLHGQSLVEEYQRDRLTLVCDLDISGGLKHRHGSIARHNQVHIDPLVASIIFSAKANDRSNLHHWKQEPVFVKNVEIVKASEGIIPSLVRFYDIHDEVSDLFGGLPYQSAIDGVYKAIPTLPERECSVIVVPLQSSENDLIESNIQGTFEVVSGIADDEGKVVWKGFSYLDLKAIVSSLNVFINTETVKVSVGEGQDARVKIVDVLLGPFNL